MNQKGRRLVAAAVLISAIAVAAGTQIISAQAAAPQPIVLGNISTIVNPSINASDLVNATKAWIAYINNERGGIKGRKIRLVTCDDQGNPSLSIQCANNLTQQGVVGLVGMWSIVFGANALATVEQAQLPIFGGLPITPQEFSSRYEFPVTPGSAGSYPALAVAMRARGVDNLAGMWFNTAAAVATSQQVENQWPGLGGKKYTPVYFSPLAPDLTPTAATALATGANGVFMATTSVAAVRVIRALRNVGYTGITGMTGVATSPALFAAAGSDLNGALLTEQGLVVGKNTPDQRLFQRIMGKAHVPADTLSLTGAAGMQYLYDVLMSIKGPITKASLFAAALKMQKWPGFLTHSMNPKYAPEGLPAIRNPYTAIYQYLGKGRRQLVKITGEPDYVNLENGVIWVSGYPAKRSGG